MILNVQESKAAVRAASMMGSLLGQGGPQPVDGDWKPQEREERAAEVNQVLGELRTGLNGHHEACPSETKCRRHSIDYKFDAGQMGVLRDCLQVAHVIFTGRGVEGSDKFRYEVLKQIRAVLFKVGASLGSTK